ncbi:MAG: outer membrane protein assembly factor BamA [Lentimonas sp.]
MRFLKVYLSIALIFGALSVPDIVVAQESGADYPVVNKIENRFSGFRSVSDEFIQSNVQLRVGMNYDPTLVDQSIRVLYGTGLFEFVEVDVTNATDGKVDVAFQFISKYTIQSIRYLGNEEFTNKRLTSKVEIEIGKPLDEYEVSVAADNVQAYYVEKGFPDATVDYRIDRDTETGFAAIYFDIDEGGKVRIDNINFEGNDNFRDKKLRKVLETSEHGWLSWLLGTGRFDETLFKEDLNLVRNFYRDNGFLDVVVEEDLVDIDFVSDNQINITITVEEGRQYSLGEAFVDGATIYTSDELLALVKVQPGDIFSPTEVDDAATAIREYYYAQGYLETNVRAERVPNIETGRIDVQFRVRESEKFYLESIKVEGNTKTKTKAIIRELALRPGDVFDRNRMEVSERRLQNTNYFEDVRLNSEDTNIPGRKDLSVAVREGRTGSFTFGAGFGSVESIVGYIEVKQGNFDLFNWRSGFQGDGQKFRFRASVGTSSNQVLIAFEEPWLFEQRLAFGVEIYRTESDYNSADYNELRTGFEFYLRRRLFELVEARVSYRMENVEIFDVDVPQLREGQDRVSKVGLSLLRDNRKTLVFTREGNRSSLVNEYAGLGGDVNYWKSEVNTAHFVPTFDALEQSFSIVARLGSITPFGDNDVPFYDRYYLGGPETLRGFDYREIGEEYVGGNTYSLVSLEYMLRIAEPLGLVVFYDWGFVNEGDFDFNMSDYADNWGVGARILLMGSPLKLDLGIPITDPTGEASGTQFNFSFGTRF